MSKQLVGSRQGFFCPVSPHIMWSWGLAFKECPVDPCERNMDECRTCRLRGQVVLVGKGRPKRDEQDKPRRDADNRRGKPQRRRGGGAPRHDGGAPRGAETSLVVDPRIGQDKGKRK